MSTKKQRDSALLFGGYGFSSYTRNFYRFLAASIFLLAAGFLRSRKNSISSFGKLSIFLAPAIYVLLAQTTWVEGIMLTEPAFASSLRHSNVLFAMLFSFILFRSERLIISSGFFISGTILCSAGVAGVIPGGGTEGFGVGFEGMRVLISALFWGHVHSLCKKNLGRH